MKTQDFMWGAMNSGAVFGRYKDANVVFKGEEAYTDGKQIVVPALAHDVDMSQETVNASRGYLDHEAGHIRHTDFDALKVLINQCKGSDVEGLQQLHNCFEDIWLERRVMHEYAGSRKNLDATWRAASTRQLSKMKEEGMPEQKISHGMVGMTNVGRKSYSDTNFDEIMEMVDPKVAEYCEKWSEEVHKCKNTQEVIDLTKGAYKILKDLEEGKEPEAQPDESDKDTTTQIGEGLELADYDESREEKEGFKVVSDKRGHEAAQSGEKIKAEKKGSEEDEGNIPGGFEPWDGVTDHKYKVYSTDGDEVFTRKSINERQTGNSQAMRSNTDADYARILSRVSSHSNVMKTKLRRALMARQRRDWDFGREQGKLDTKRLVPAYNRQKNVYKQRIDRDEMDTAVNLLVDLSGSMHGERTQLASEAVVAFCECLEGSGIKYQVSGFSTEDTYTENDNGNYHRVGDMNYYIFKDFNEPLRTARGAISAIEDGAESQNADRCAVEWAANVLKQRKEARKVLFVFSDGSPACNTQNVSYDSLRTTLADGVKEVHKSGIQTVGVGIQSGSVKGLYQHYKVVNDLSDLTNTTFDQLTRVILDGRM